MLISNFDLFYNYVIINDVYIYMLYPKIRKKLYLCNLVFSKFR